MSYIPRRRLVLASARSARVHTQWSTSQIPWDAEEIVSADDQELCTNSDATCFTQETALTMTTRQQADWGLQPDQYPAGRVDSRAVEQAHDSLDSVHSCELPVKARSPCEHVSTWQQPVSLAGAVDQFTLPREEYQEIYNFLTKGTGQVQGVSAKERALFKLADLRQVCSHGRCMLLLRKDVIGCTLQVMRLHGVTQGGRTKQVLWSQALLPNKLCIAMYVRHA